ncbi:MAG: hypothetical protein GY953_46920, partial [bacterium]|nr:hypothetical protein [bacterium]
NMAGAFWQPSLVLADTNVLDTLPDRELLAGYAEVVKYGLINDPTFFAWLEGHGAAVCDGTAEARLREQTAAVLLPYGHTRLSFAPEMVRQTLVFLRHYHFVEARSPN